MVDPRALREHRHPSPAGLIVLDVDPRNGGDVALLALTRQSRNGPLPETLTAQTGGGGLHIWLRHSGASRGLLCQGVDVKTNSGYVVAAPSTHSSGNRYQWLTDLPIAPAPVWIRMALAPPLQVARPSSGSSGDGLAGFVAKLPQGQRNTGLNWAAFTAYRDGAGPDVIDAIRRAALHAGLPATEVDRTIISAARGAVT